MEKDLKRMNRDEERRGALTGHACEQEVATSKSSTQVMEDWCDASQVKGLRDPDVG